MDLHGKQFLSPFCGWSDEEEAESSAKRLKLDPQVACVAGSRALVAR